MTTTTAEPKTTEAKHHPDYLEVPVWLGVDDKTRHWFYLGLSRTEAEKQSSLHAEDMGGGTVGRTIRVWNGRNNEDLTLDQASFQLVSDCPTSLSTEDFYKIQDGDEALKKVYFDEVSSFVQSKLGCDKVFCFHSQVRNADKAGTRSGVQGYAGGGPHTDSSPLSGDELVLHFAQQQEKGDDDTKGEDEKKDQEDVQFSRYLYLNLWRSIAEAPIENNHLAVLDERTVVKPDDYITKDLFAADFSAVQYGLNARHASHHRWYYFPRMTRNEAVLFKQTDSDWTHPGRICFHMSVADPDAPKMAPPRESIETRMICYWKEAAVNSMPTHENISSELIQKPLELAKNVRGRGGKVLLLDQVSLWELVKAVIRKIPLIGRYLVGSSGGQAVALLSASSKDLPDYTGDPSDYVDKFIGVVNSYPFWPAVAKKWLEGVMAASRGDAKLGIATITSELVEDRAKYQKTFHFASKDKKAILECLLANERYMATAKNHFGKYAVASSPAPSNSG